MTTPIWTKRTIQMVSPSSSAAATAVMGTATSEFLDTTDANYATIVISLSSEATTDNTGPTLSLQESDTTDATNFATVVADVTPNITAAALHVYGIDMKVRKKFLMMRITPDTDGTDGLIKAQVTGTLERMKQTPTNTTDMVNVGAVTLVP